MLEDERESQNIEDRRGMSGGRMAIGGGGCFTLVIALVIFLAGGNPLRYLQQQAQQALSQLCGAYDPCERVSNLMGNRCRHLADFGQSFDSSRFALQPINF